VSPRDLRRAGRSLGQHRFDVEERLPRGRQFSAMRNAMEESAAPTSFSKSLIC
jgi:hypothetical protein